MKGNLTQLIKNCIEKKNYDMRRIYQREQYCSIPYSLWEDNCSKCSYRVSSTINMKEACEENLSIMMYKDTKYFLCKKKN